MSEEEPASENLERTMPPVFAEMWRYLRGRMGRPTPPRRDPTTLPVEFQPRYRVVIWDGDPADHRTAECEPLLCSKPDQYGEHTEVRPDGFIWGGAIFHSLFEALENQAFSRWYESGGKEILERNELVVHDPQYEANEVAPLPRFNFFLHEHIEQMTAQEIMAYNRTGDIPVRFRRRARDQHQRPPRGRNEPPPDALGG